MGFKAVGKVKVEFVPIKNTRIMAQASGGNFGLNQYYEQRWTNDLGMIAHEYFH